MRCLIHLSGPTSWWFFHPDQCDSLIFPTQSPVALDSGDALVSNLSPVDFSNYEDSLIKATLVNDGAALMLVPKYEEGSPRPKVSGGPLIPGAAYELDHVIWHWGETDGEGGEHVIDGKRYV